MPAGHSFLPASIQALVEEELRDGRTISAVALRAGVSRDQVRTIRNRMADAGWQTPSDELDALRARLARVEADLAEMRRRHVPR
jgi:transposase-like protein